MSGPGKPAHLQLHQSLGGEADHLAQNICVGALLHQPAQGHDLVGHLRFLGSGLSPKTQPYRRPWMTTAAPLTRYGAP